MTPLRIAVVGPGLIGKKHIELIVQNPDTELAGIVAPLRPPNVEVALKHQVPFHTSLPDLLAQERPDGVIIASPNIFHVEQAAICIERDTPVLIEKPVAHSYDDGTWLRELTHLHAGKVLVGHHRAHSPIMQCARAVIASGQLGRLVSVMGSAQFYKPAEYFAAGPWRTLPGGGPILINLIHEIGNLRALCGEIAAIQALASSEVRGFAVEDSVALTLQFRSGVLGTFLLSDTVASPRSWELTAAENPAYPHYPDQDCYVLGGTLGTLAVPTMQIHRYAGAASWWEPFEMLRIPFAAKDPLACQLDNFVAVIRGQAAPLVSLDDGLENLRVIEALWQALQSDRTVHLTPTRLNVQAAARIKA